MDSGFYLYALVLAEIAQQSAILVAQRRSCRHASTVISHLLLVAGIVTTSWVAWSLAIASERHVEHRLDSVFSLPYLLLVIDVGLLAVYFVLAKQAGIPDSKDKPIIPSARAESFWLMVVFGGYLVWDTVFRGLMEKEFVLSWVAWGTLRVVTTRLAVVVADMGMLALVFLFRAMKSVITMENKFSLDKRVIALGIIFATYLMLARLFNRPRSPNARV